MVEAGEKRCSKWDAWWIAVRPHTLPAAASPVGVGMALAYEGGVFAPAPACLALLGALLIQAGTNLANDYFDAERGVDDRRTEGFTRVTSSGLLEPDDVWNGMVIAFAGAVAAGVYLVYVGGLPILIVGITGIFFGIAYSGGPMPFGSIGLGDLMVFLYFGVIAVSGTYYVQSAAIRAGPFPVGIPDGTLSGPVLVASLPAAAFSTAILVVNNIRDLDTDRAAGKTTLAVLIGRTASRVEFTLLLVLPHVVPVCLWGAGTFPSVILLPLISAPAAVPVGQTVWTNDTGKALNRALSGTGKLLLVHSLLFSAGLLAA